MPLVFNITNKHYQTTASYHSNQSEFQTQVMVLHSLPYVCITCFHSVFLLLWCLAEKRFLACPSLCSGQHLLRGIALRFRLCLCFWSLFWDNSRRFRFQFLLFPCHDGSGWGFSHTIPPKKSDFEHKMSPWEFNVEQSSLCETRMMTSVTVTVLFWFLILDSWLICWVLNF